MNFKEINVLVVDDSRVMRRIILKMLHKMGFEKVHEAANGKVALDLLQGEVEVDLILSDWSMPGLSGLDLLKEVRGQASTKDMPFVLLTAEAQLYTILMAFKARVSDYMTKPFTPDYFSYIVNRVLNGKNANPA
jgi:two-component system chemotaxis response regulator CheY